MITPIFKGDSTRVDNIKVKGETSYALYSCKAIISKEIGGSPLVEKTITPDVTDGFNAYFTAQETETLAIGVYYVVYEVTKTEDSIITYRRESHKKIRIELDGI